MNIKRLLKYSGFGLLGFGVIGAAAISYAALTTHGQDIVRNTLVDFIHAYNIATIEGASGNVLRDMRIARVRVADDESHRLGDWLDIVNVHVVWQPLHLFTGQQLVQLVQADLVDMTRLPIHEQKDTEQDNATANNSGLPIGLRLIGQLLPQKIKLGDIRVALKDGDDPYVVAFNSFGYPSRYAITLHTQSGVSTTFNAVMRLHPRDIALQMALQEQENGLISALIGAPSDSPIHMAARVATSKQGLVTVSDTDMLIGAHHISVGGTYDLKHQIVDMRAEARLHRLEDWHSVTGVLLGGGMHIQAQALGPLQHLALKTSVTGAAISYDTHQMRDYRMTVDAAGDVTRTMPRGDVRVAMNGIYQEQSVNVQANAAYDGKAMRVDDVSLQYGESRLTGSGAWGMQKETIIASIQAAEWDIQKMMPSFPLPGLLDATVDVKGKRDDLNAEGVMTLVSDQGRSHASIQAHILDQNAIDTQLVGHVEHGAIAFDADVDAMIDPEKAMIRHVAIDGTGLSLMGTAQVALDTFLAEGNIALQADDLAPLGTVLGYDMRGTAKADAVFSVDAEKQSITAAAQASDVVIGDTSITTLSLDAAGAVQERLDLALQAEGRISGKPVQADIKAFGHVQTQEDGFASIDASVERLQARYDRTAMRLLKPTSIHYGADAWRLDETQLRIGNGVLTAQALVSSENVDGRMNLRDVRIEDVLPHTEYRGRIGGSVVLKGTPTQPQADIRADTSMRVEGKTVRAQMNGQWTHEKLTMRLKAHSDEASLNGDAVVQGGLSLLPAAVHIQDDTVLLGSVRADVPMDMANSFLWSGGHRLDGSLKGTMRLAGTVSAPQLNGVMNIADASYEQVTSGICLRNIQARIRGTQDKVVIERFEAKDPKGQFMKGRGSLVLSDDYPLNMDVDFDAFRLFCGGLAMGDIDGTIGTKGTLSDMMIKGRLTLGPLDIQIPGAGGNAAIPEVTVERVRPGKRQTDTQTQSVQRLDIVIDAPSRVFVRGRGLDAEFGGKISISGFASNPLIEGRLASKRGQFQFLDRNMKLSKAVIRFDGPMPPSPFLEVGAVTTVRDSELTVNLTGPVAKPSLALKSSPARPQDEILALLLFGREVAKISPFEALQLAQAARVLSGQASDDPSLLDMARDSLGLDVLNVSTDDDNNVNVSTGKYVTEKVFVGVQQGATPESRKVVSDIELTPSVSAKTTVDGDGNQGYGAQWRYDY